jgi:hypothetical protein
MALESTAAIPAREQELDEAEATFAEPLTFAQTEDEK